MKTPDRQRTPLAAVNHHTEDHHIADYFRVLYKRRWIVIPLFIIVFVVGAINAMRQTPVYEGRVQLLIESDTPKVARLDQMFQAENGYDDDFRNTQYRILQSRSLAKRTIDRMRLWEVPRLGNGPVPRGKLSLTGLAWMGVDVVMELVKKPFEQAAPEPVTPAKAVKAAPSATAPGQVPDETAAQSGRIDEFLGGLSVLPVRSSRIVEVKYASTDPEFAAQAANAVSKEYIQQNMEAKFSTSKEAADWLSERLSEQRKQLEASESALQAYKEKNGTVSVADSASNIVVQRLTDLNGALTKAKTDRINKEALYNQLKSAEGSGALDTYPAVITNEYIQKLKADLADLQRQQGSLAQRYGERNPEMIKIRTTIEAADAKLRGELTKVVESVRNEYQTALSQERSLQSALNSQKTEALSLNRKGIEYGVLTREAESNKQIYESLMQRTKETGIASELRASNVRVVDPAEIPRAPISPNLQRDFTVSLGLSLIVSVGLAFFLEHVDNRIRTPQELKAYVGVPFLGMVPAIPADKNAPGGPLVHNAVPPNFSEAFKTVRTNVLFSSAEDGMRTVVVTSAGPGDGKTVVASNLAIALAQSGQRVLLIDADMRRPRVHEIFTRDQEPGLSNILTGNAKVSQAILKSEVNGLWLLTAGHIPPNPAELLGSRRFLDFIATLDELFDWAIIDTPPVLAVADSTVVAKDASGVVFVVGADKTSRQEARAAVEQLDSAKAHLIGSVLNRVNLTKHPYYYASYYRKEYARYYVSSAN